MENKKLIGWAYRTRNKNVVESVNSEMIRRMINSIDGFNEKSSFLTHILIIFGIINMVLLIINILILII